MLRQPVIFGVIALAVSASLLDRTILHWSFEGPDATSRLLDSSGNGLHAVLNGTYTQNISWVPGVVGSYALQLRPTWSSLLNDDTQGTGCPFLNSPALRYYGIRGMSPFTLALWIKPDFPVSFLSDAGAWVAALGSYTTYLQTESIVWAVQPGRTLRVGEFSSTRSYPSMQPAVGEWVHVATTYDGTDGSAALSTYINGRLTDVSVVQANFYFAARLYVGRFLSTSASQLCYSGLVDDIRLYDRALSASEAYDLWRGYCDSSSGWSSSPSPK
eukprot:m51a1_g10 hypothetical protein (272) ;mRNA; f:34612-35427